MTEREQQVRDLKAKAYDILAALERGRAILQQVNQQIAELENAPAEKEPTVDG